MSIARLNKDFYRDLLDNLYDGIYFVDRDRRITYWNKGSERLTGCKSSEVVGTRCSDNILMHINDEGINLCEGQCPLSETMADGRPREAEVYLHHKDGHRLPVLIRVSPIQDSSGQVIGAVEIFSDNSHAVAARKRIEELHEMALLDHLTRIVNRRFIEMTLQAKLVELQRYGYPFGILFIDIDHFKKINDTYGHDVGDRVLKMVANTLVKNARLFDHVGRWGGEEFLSIIINVNKNQLYSIANRFRLLIEQSAFTIKSDFIRVTVSIGGTIADPNDTVDKIIERADQQMYQSKISGRNCVSII